MTSLGYLIRELGSNWDPGGSSRNIRATRDKAIVFEIARLYSGLLLYEVRCVEAGRNVRCANQRSKSILAKVNVIMFTKGANLWATSIIYFSVP